MSNAKQDLFLAKKKLKIILKEEILGEKKQNLLDKMHAGEGLPDGIYQMGYDDGLYHYKKTDMTSEEIEKLMLYKQTIYFNTIKNCLVTLTVIASVFLLIKLILLLF